MIGTWEILKTTVNIPLVVGSGKFINNPDIYVFRKSDKFVVAMKRRRRAYFDLNHNSAAGVDEESWNEYGINLLERINDLHGRIHQERYRPQPFLRVWVPKPDGRQRPIGIAALEDKIVQQALVWTLESIYEEDFLGFSYGFRPGRSQHQALDALYVAITQRKVSYISDADIQGFFDTIQHDWMLKFIKHRISDKRILRLVEKTLRAGVTKQRG